MKQWLVVPAFLAAASLVVLVGLLTNVADPFSVTASADIATIGIDVIGGDVNGNVVTPCTATGDPNVDYPCNNSTVLGPIDNCVALQGSNVASADVLR